MRICRAKMSGIENAYQCVQVSRWVREFGQKIEIVLTLDCVVRFVQPFRCPILLPLFLYLSMTVRFHSDILSQVFCGVYSRDVAGLDIDHGAIRFHSSSCADNDASDEKADTLNGSNDYLWYSNRRVCVFDARALEYCSLYVRPRPTVGNRCVSKMET
jgi:hypothetical protein